MIYHVIIEKTEKYNLRSRSKEDENHPSQNPLIFKLDKNQDRKLYLLKKFKLKSVES